MVSFSNVDIEVQKVDSAQRPSRTLSQACCVQPGYSASAHVPPPRAEGRGQDHTQTNAADLRTGQAQGMKHREERWESGLCPLEELRGSRVGPARAVESQDRLGLGQVLLRTLSET